MHYADVIACDKREAFAQGSTCDEAIQASSIEWIASRSLPSGAHSRDPLARNDEIQNFTDGTASVSARVAPRSKKSLRVKPNMPANKAAGICWMPVLYSWTALLKKRRLAAILFSRSDSSPASCWKLALALRSG